MSATRVTLDQLLAALERKGCEPREVSAGVWFALCPACLDRGRRELLVVRADHAHGFRLGSCAGRSA